MSSSHSLPFILQFRGRQAGSLFQFGAQFRPSPVPVRDLGSFILTSHLHSGRPMAQPHTGTSLLDFLPPAPGAEDKPFRNLGAKYSDRGQPAFKLGVHGFCSSID
jgi:hypothetical protein